MRVNVAVETTWTLRGAPRGMDHGTVERNVVVEIEDASSASHPIVAAWLGLSAVSPKAGERVEHVARLSGARWFLDAGRVEDEVRAGGCRTTSSPVEERPIPDGAKLAAANLQEQAERAFAGYRVVDGEILARPIAEPRIVVLPMPDETFGCAIRTAGVGLPLRMMPDVEAHEEACATWTRHSKLGNPDRLPEQRSILVEFARSTGVDARSDAKNRISSLGTPGTRAFLDLRKGLGELVSGPCSDQVVSDVLQSAFELGSGSYDKTARARSAACLMARRACDRLASAVDAQDDAALSML